MKVSDLRMRHHRGASDADRNHPIRRVAGMRQPRQLDRLANPVRELAGAGGVGIRQHHYKLFPAIPRQQVRRTANHRTDRLDYLPKAFVAVEVPVEVVKYLETVHIE